MIGTGVSEFIRGQIVPDDNGEITPPENIIPSVAAAYQQYVTLRGSHLDRIAIYAMIDGMVGGNPPYDQEELEANGLGHITNFNNFKGRSAYEKSAQGYWNLINSTEVYVKIVLAGKYPNIAEYAQIMARHFSDVTKEWDDFNTNYNLIGAQLTKNGYCPIIFSHEQSPLWEVIDVSRFYIPPQTQTFMSKLTTVAVDSTYTVQDLYEIYDSKEATKWNKKALAKFLVFRANSVFPNMNEGSPFSNFVDVERMLNNSDVSMCMQYFSDTVRLVNLYQKEYDGKISHYIFSSLMYGAGQYAPDKTEQDFLYFYDRQYKCIDEAIIIFTASPGEWTIHGNMGVSQKMYAPAQAVNMLDCNVVDMSKMAATPIIRTLATGGRDGSAIRFYPGVPTDIGAAELAQNDLGKNISQLVAASGYLTQGIDLNAINSGDDPSMPDRSQGSLAPSEARNKAFKEFGVLKNAVAHFYKTFDDVIRVSFIRFLKMPEGAPGYEYAEEFKRRCLEDGVPEFLFDTKKVGLKNLPVQFRSVKATRVAGDGSTLARIMGLEALGKISSTFNPKEMSAFKKDWVEATVGVDYVSTYAASDDQQDELSGGASLARVEDNQMKQGMEVLWSPDNDQEAHADEHMGVAGQIVQAVAQQQMSPVDADKYMTNGLPHITQHIQFMAQAPQFYQGALSTLEQPFKQLQQWAQLNRRNALAMIAAAKKKQQEDAAATQQVMDDAQRKDFVAKADMKIRQEESDAKIARSDEAADNKANNAADTAQRKLDIEQAKANRKLAIEESTAKGRTQIELAKETADQLSQRISDIAGNTPSTVDFE